MNKKIIILLITLIFVIIIALGSYLLISKDAMLIRNPVIVQQNALITYAIGDCYYKESEDHDWIELEIGQKLKIGFILKTLEDGEIDIRFSKSTLMKMDNNTILKITENTLKHLIVNIEKGKLFAKFHKLFSDQEFNVTSGNTVAGIRGTDLVFETFSDKTNIYALSGITEVYNVNFSNEKILLAFQKKTTVYKDAPPTQPERMEIDQINELQTILNLIHSEKVFLISNSIQFEANTAKILPSSLPELEIVLTAMKSSNFNIEIAGHTANIGSSSAMYDLSLLRAQAIKDYLIDKGISKKRLKIEGYGGSKPLSDNATEIGKAKNRRVEFIILDD